MRSLDFGLRSLRRPEIKLQSSKTKDQKHRFTHHSSLLIQPGEFDTGVVRLEDLFRTPALARQPVSTDLAHAHAVPPTSSGKNKTGHATVGIVVPIDYKQLFPQAQCGSNSTAANMGQSIT